MRGPRVADHYLSAVMIYVRSIASRLECPVKFSPGDGSLVCLGSVLSVLFVGDYS